MTAVFAFVFDEMAVIATDTLRVDPLGWLPNQVVEKSYCWKGLIPFGAAGTGAFVKRVADKMALCEADYSADKEGFLAAFEKARQEVMDAIHDGPNALEKAVARATILAAVPTLSAPAHIFSIDFTTGAVDQKPLAIAAEGTLPSKFQEIAEAVLAECTGSSPEPQALALECMQRAVACCPDHVGWPMDVRVVKLGAEPSSTSARLSPQEAEGA